MKNGRHGRQLCIKKSQSMDAGSKFYRAFECSRMMLDLSQVRFSVLIIGVMPDEF